MPVDLLNKISDICGVPLSELEDKWEEVKAGAVLLSERGNYEKK